MMGLVGRMDSLFCGKAAVIKNRRTDSFTFLPAQKLWCCRHQVGDKQDSTGVLRFTFESAQTQKKTNPKGLVFFWWGRTDSNHRSETQQIYSLSPLATRELPHIELCSGAGRRTRTPDLLITNQLLYQLSYTGVSNRTRLL